MTKELSRTKRGNAGPQRARARWLVFAICVALTTLAGAVRAASTGTVDRISGWYPAGTNLTVKATPNAYSEFDYWTGDTNSAVITGNHISFDVTGGIMLSAVFKEAITASNAVPYWWLAEQNPAWADDFEAAVTNDADSDGFTTGQEYWSGTDPIDPNSFLHIAGIEVTTTNVRLVWSHARVADGNIPPITIHWRSSLTTGDWVKAGELSPVNGTNTFNLLIQDTGFYRLSVTNMP